MSKRIIAIATAAVCMTAFAGCSNQTKTETKTKTSMTTSAAPTAQTTTAAETTVESTLAATESGAETDDSIYPLHAMSYEKEDDKIVITLKENGYVCNVTYHFDEADNLLMTSEIKFTEFGNMSIEELCDKSGFVAIADFFEKTDEGYEASYVMEEINIPEEYRTYEGIIAYCEETMQYYNKMPGETEDASGEPFEYEDNSVDIDEYEALAYVKTNEGETPSIYLDLTKEMDTAPDDIDDLDNPEITMTVASYEDIDVTTKIEMELYSRAIINNTAGWYYRYSLGEDEMPYDFIELTIGDETRTFYWSEIAE